MKKQQVKEMREAAAAREEERCEQLRKAADEYQEEKDDVKKGLLARQMVDLQRGASSEEEQKARERLENGRLSNDHDGSRVVKRVYRNLPLFT